MCVCLLTLIGVFGRQSGNEATRLYLYMYIDGSGNKYVFATRLGGCFSFYDTISAGFTAGCIAVCCSGVALICSLISLRIPRLLHTIGYLCLGVGTVVFQLIAWVISIQVHTKSFCEETDIFKEGSYQYAFWLLMVSWISGCGWCVFEGIFALRSNRAAEKQQRRRSHGSSTSSSSTTSATLPISKMPQ